MVIYFNNTELEIEVSDDSYRFRQIMGDHNLTINFSMPEYVEIPIGAYCVYEGRVYTLCKPQNYQKSGARKYKYTLILESEEVKSRKWMFRNTNDGKLKFSLTGKPIDFLEMFVANLNMRDPGWTVGRCIAGNEKCLSFSHELCDAVGKRIADEYQTELEYDRKVVSLGRVEYNKANPLPLAYGNGKGFIPGTKRESENAYPIDTLYVQGDTRNINYSIYAPDGTNHSDTLLLPLSQHIWYDGKYFYTHNAAMQKWGVFDEDNNTWGECAEPANAREYVTTADGQSLKRGDKQTTDFESSVDCTDIYPSRVGTITEVIPVDGKDSDGKPFVCYDFVDDTIPKNLNYKECLIEGNEMTVIPQSGMLVGREFGVAYDHDKRRFAIVPCEQDGYMMPGDVYIPHKGDKYAVFGIQLPNAYLCDNATKTGASWDMFRYAVKYMFDNEEQKVTYTGELDGIYARDNWADLAGKIVLGGYVRLDDPEFEDGILVRITSIKEFINKQHKPKIELSNTTSSAGFMQRIGKIEAEEVVAENSKKEVKAYTKRQFRDTKQTMKMLEKAFDYFSASIQPVTVHTMQLLAGDESLQFQFVQSSGTSADGAFCVSFDEEKKLLNVMGGIPAGFCRLQHMTLGINNISSTHAESEHLFWILEPFVSEYLGDENADKAYYLYARCRKVGDTSMTDYDRFILRETPISFAGDEDYYHMLVGILNSEYGGARSFTSLYGYTEILPGRITTDVVVSADGKTYFNLKLGEIGGRINFKDGLVSGVIGIGNDNGINAGMSGDGENASDVRIWAGGTIANRTRAPFRVFNDGSIDSSKGKIGGWSITETGIVSDEIEQSSGGLHSKSRTSLNSDGTIGGNLLNVNLNSGWIKARLWDDPIMEWSERYLKMHARVAIPFEPQSFIVQGGEDVPVLSGFTNETNSFIIEPCTETVYYLLPSELDDYNGVTVRIYNPATRTSNWKASNAYLRYRKDKNSPYLPFLGKFTGTALSIPIGKMVVITGVREAVAGGYFGQDALKWYVEGTA